jgi:hypothetical protein
VRVLLIAPYYFPLENPRAYRWSQVVKTFIEEGIEVTVVTAGDHIRTVTHVGEAIVRCGYSTPDKRLSKEIGPDRKTAGRGWGRRFMKSWMWPDESMFWIRPALKAAKRELGKGATDVLISVSHPFSSHIIASKLRSQFHFKWIVDIGDPFIHQNYPPRNNPKLWNSKNKITEKAVLSSCDMISVTNQTLADKYSNDYGISKKKISVMPPMHSPLPDQLSELMNHQEVNIGYYGTFYDGVRSPEIILEARNHIESPKPIHWHFYGGIKGHHKEEINKLIRYGDKVYFHGVKSREEVIGNMTSMDYLLNVGNNTSLQVPSKLVDYLAAQRPVLHLAQHKDDCSTAFLSPYDGITVWKKWAPENISITQQEPSFSRHVSEFSPESIGKEYLKLV